MDGREVHATLPETGLTHRIRALFESAVRSDHGSQCPLLWRMYLSFLVGQTLGVCCCAERCSSNRRARQGAQDPGDRLTEEGPLRTREGPGRVTEEGHLGCWRYICVFL